MDPPLWLNELNLFILAHYEAFLKVAGSILLVIGERRFLVPKGTQNQGGPGRPGPPEAYLSRWRVNSGDLDVPEFITR